MLSKLAYDSDSPDSTTDVATSSTSCTYSSHQKKTIKKRKVKSGMVAKASVDVQNLQILHTYYTL